MSCSLGNIIAAVNEKFGGPFDRNELKSIYHAGKLGPLLPDGCAWLSFTDDDGLVVSLEAIEPTESRGRYLPLREDGTIGDLSGFLSPGALLVASTLDRVTEISLSDFPFCDFHKLFPDFFDRDYYLGKKDSSDELLRTISRQKSVQNLSFHARQCRDVRKL